MNEEEKTKLGEFIKEKRREFRGKKVNRRKHNQNNTFIIITNTDHDKSMVLPCALGMRGILSDTLNPEILRIEREV